MAKSQTVFNKLKNRFVTGIIIIWGFVIIAMAVSLIEYFSTGHSVLLLVVVALVVTCGISLILLIFTLPVLRSLDMLELWITDAARQDMQPVPDLPFLNKSTEPFLQACNALAARFKADSYRRVQFVERLVHDMRSSLASIQGYAEVLIDYHIGIEGASLQTYGKIIANQTYRLVKMIEDAQTTTCISENQLILELEPVKPSALLSALIAEARRNTVREIIYQDDLGACIITGDSFRLREMLSKLVDNALSLSTSSISIHAMIEKDESGSWAKIKVEEHGNVLSELEIAALFHPPFPSRDRKTSPIFRSSLSIFIVKAIIDGHNGKFIIQSQPGQGTTYTIFLPVQKVNA